MSKYGIAEWFGEPFGTMSPEHRQRLARVALGLGPALPCPFQRGRPPCGKKGGVCSIRAPGTAPAITCPKRFEENDLIPRWLAGIVGFDEIHMAREVPFMRSPTSGRSAGRIDLVAASDGNATVWFGIEIQAVYFSGAGMEADFRTLAEDDGIKPPNPTENRRPDWRSSSAKRLMPQLQVKAPTLRRWGTKLAVAVDRPFFDAIGGPTDKPSRDLDDGDIVWLVPHMTDGFQLERDHWEVLSLEESSNKLLAADTVKRREFEDTIRAKLRKLEQRSEDEDHR